MSEPVAEKDLEPAVPSACNTLSSQRPCSSLPSFLFQLKCQLMSPAFPDHLVNPEPTRVPPLLLFCFIVSMASTSLMVPLCSVLVPILTTVSAPRERGTPALLRAASPVPRVDSGHILAVCLGE